MDILNEPVSLMYSGFLTLLKMIEPFGFAPQVSRQAWNMKTLLSRSRSRRVIVDPLTGLRKLVPWI